MKKFILFIIICFMFLPCVYADDAEASDGVEIEDEDDFYWEDDVDLGGFWIQDRGFEMSLFYFNDIHFANNYLTTNMIFSEIINFDLDDIPPVFRMQMNAVVTPFYFKYNSKRGWGFGLETQIQLTGFTGLNFDLTKISDAKDKKTDFGFAVYSNVTPNAFFHIRNFKVSVMPTFFTPQAYAKSSISYTLDGANSYADIKYDIDMYLPFVYDDMEDSGGLPKFTNLTGFDLSASVEYPLSRELGLEEIHSILNFDVGAGFYALPFIPATMKDGVSIKGSASIDGSEDITNPKVVNNFDGDPQSFSRNKYIYRPFTMHFWANWRPFGTELLTVTPLLGFSVNTLYVEPGSIEGGITGHLNLSNLFHVKVGINYMDRMWINSLFLALNLRAVEFNIGTSLRSQDFVRSWEGGGFGITLGMKYGW